MKNKIYYILLCLLSSFAFMNNVFAEGELNFSVSTAVVGGETTVVKGSEVTINVALNSDSNIDTCTFEINQDSGLEFISRTEMNNYNNMLNGSNQVVVSRNNTEVGFVSGQNVMGLNYKVNSNGKVNIKTVSCSSTADNKTGVYKDVSVDFKTIEVADDTSLSNLFVVGGTMSPSFSSNVYSYIIRLVDKDFSLNFTASNADYQDDITVVDVNGNALDPSNIIFSNDGGQGKMQITVTVNKKTQYTLMASYVQDEVDNSLASLKVDGKEITLESGKYEYTITVGRSVSRVEIDAALKDSNNFKFAEGNGPTTLQLGSSTTSYALIIQPKDLSLGTENAIYMLTIVKEGTTSNNNSNNNSDSQGNTTTNPVTGGISMFIMAFVLLASLVGSIVLYQKNLEGYDK